MFQKLISDIRDWWQFASIKLAAFVGILTSVFTANPELLVGLIGVVPVDPLVRLLFSLGVGAVVFLIPVAVRMWPQDIEIPKDRES